MADLGKCMLFYLKYAAEMERLYEAKEPKVEGLPDPDQVLKQIKQVGDTGKYVEPRVCGYADERYRQALLDRRVYRTEPSSLDPLGLVSRQSPSRG